MKSFAVLALTAGASAQVASYLAVGDAIDAQVKSLDALVKAYTGGAGSAVLAKASTLLDVVNSGASAIAGFESFTTLNDALSLLSTYQPLASDISTVVNDLIGKKSLIDQEPGLCNTAGSLLVAESSAAVKLAAAVIDQLQDPALAGADGIASGSVIIPITSALARGTSAFASCPSASASQTSSVPSSTSTATATGSAPTSTVTSTSTPTSTVTATATGSGSTCTSSGYNSKQIKKCLKIISSAALGQGSYGYGEL